MPKRYKSLLTNRNLKHLKNASPETRIILLVTLVGGSIFITGFCLLVSFVGFLETAGLGTDFSNPLSILGIFVLISLTFAFIVGMSIFFIVKYNKKIELKYRGLRIANIDVMSGVEFEQYLKRVIINKGYNVSTTSVSGDLGVDLIAVRNTEKIAIQAKRHTSKVSRRAISDAVAGMHHYGCNKAMVITNNYFSPGAITLAKSTNCILIDRDTLAKWVNEFQNISEGN